MATKKHESKKNHLFVSNAFYIYTTTLIIFTSIQKHLRSQRIDISGLSLEVQIIKMFMPCKYLTLDLGLRGAVVVLDLFDFKWCDKKTQLYDRLSSNSVIMGLGIARYE